MPPDFIQHITFKVDKGSALFTFQMEMFPAFSIVFDILIAGAFAFAEYIFSDSPLSRQFFQMPVDRGLPDTRSFIGKIPRRLINRNMPAAQRLKVIKDTFPLPGGIICRAIMFHARTVADRFYIVNMKMNVVFIFGMSHRENVSVPARLEARPPNQIFIFFSSSFHAAYVWFALDYSRKKSVWRV
jgi:hypothetical protein